MSGKETIRKEAKRRGISRSKTWKERKAQDAIDQMGGDLDIVYAWRWSNDNTYAKIGVSKVSNLESRMATTYHPTDDPILIGVRKCRSRKEANKIEKDLLCRLKRPRLDREWVIIDENFNWIIDEEFISDPNMLSEIFGNPIPKLKGEAS